MMDWDTFRIPGTTEVVKCIGACNNKKKRIAFAFFFFFSVLKPTSPSLDTRAMEQFLEDQRNTEQCECSRL